MIRLFNYHKNTPKLGDWGFHFFTIGDPCNHFNAFGYAHREMYDGAVIRHYLFIAGKQFDWDVSRKKVNFNIPKQEGILRE